MRTLLAATMVALFFPMSAIACAKPAGSASLESGMVNWINDQRAANGLKPLKVSSALKAAAQDHACDMATRGYFAHQRPGGPKLSVRVKSNGYKMRRAAENIAKSPRPNVADAATMWRNSPPHWAAILKSNVRDIGVATAVDSGGVYWVMNVGAEK